MSITKIAMAFAASLGLALVGSAANAEPTRAAAAVPGVVSAKAIKLSRKAAPAANESRATEGGTAVVAVIGAGLVGFAVGKVVDGEDSPGG